MNLQTATIISGIALLIVILLVRWNVRRRARDKRNDS